MKIVIDIPEAVYDQICREKFDGILTRAIRFGRPLPKGHGRLIDGDELASGCDEPFWCRWLNEIEDAPTIVPAEMEVEDTPTAKVNTPTDTSTDTISRQAAIDEIKRWIGYIDEDMILRIQTGLKKVPSAQRTGKWIKADTHNYLFFKNDRIYKCSNCGHLLDFEGVNGGRGDANYCPNCGARLEVEE